MQYPDGALIYNAWIISSFEGKRQAGRPHAFWPVLTPEQKEDTGLWCYRPWSTPRVRCGSRPEESDGQEAQTLLGLVSFAEGSELEIDLQPRTWLGLSLK